MKERDKCACDYTESGLCSECPGSEAMQDKEVTLGGCYHTGLTYALGYDANGEIELDSKLFTNLDTGLDGGAMEALVQHRNGFDPNRDVEKFIVALKPVKVIARVTYGRSPEPEDDCNCETYGVKDGEGNPVLCNDCAKEMTCEICGNYDDCDCFCSECGGIIEDDCSCDYDEDDCLGCGLDPNNCGGCGDSDECDECLDELSAEFDNELVSDTFRTMNPFERARYVKRTQSKE